MQTIINMYIRTIVLQFLGALEKEVTQDLVSPAVAAACQNHGAGQSRLGMCKWGCQQSGAFFWEFLQKGS